MTAPASGGTIVWLGGWSMPASAMLRLTEQLPECRHVLVELGQAESQASMWRLAQGAVSRERCRLADDAGGGGGRSRAPLVLAGWSLGGLLALRLAADGHGDGLVLLAGTACFVRSQAEADRGWSDAVVRRMGERLLRDRAEARFRDQMFTPEEREAGLPGLLPPAGAWPLAALDAGLRILREEDLRCRLPDIEVPALIVHGAEDRICPYAAAVELAEAMSDARLLSLADCGHAPFLGREEQVAQEWRRWRHGKLDGIDRTPVRPQRGSL
ncbi:alpha/beta fold hydrolase [Paenibacillus albicereus]|uniref:Alpha/beta fold hydrolase n=1 Tax=Paenibacillus albicereus TaxID=2726185 RepID=A0A6H2H0A2_9BACL|nr:alpha/beta fold hydrolase [Paenibacillus albicereus]QJC53090.1 alpha/beta fold hydrolase [Paenibacillus albicereus]